MPTVDASQFTTIKRYQTSINASLGANPLKFRVPSSFGGYRPGYSIGFLPPNAVVSNKEIVALPPTSEGTATPAPPGQPTGEANSTPTGGGKTDNTSPQQDPPPLQGTVDNDSIQYPPYVTGDIQAVSPSRNLISYKFLLNMPIFALRLIMANNTDRITNMKFTWDGGSKEYTADSGSVYYDSINNFYYITALFEVPFSDVVIVMDITTENNIEGIGLRTI
jgi:hypothetical protein